MNPEMGEMNGGSGGLGWGGDENGKVAYGGDLVVGVEGKNHRVVKCGIRRCGWGEVPGKALL